MDREFLIDLFADFGPVTIRRMFSGYGISADGTVSSDLKIATQGASFTDAASLTAVVTQLENAEVVLRNKSRELSANLGVLTARQDFTKSLVSTLTTGADNLVTADTNEEAANLLRYQQAYQASSKVMSNRDRQQPLHPCPQTICSGYAA